MCVLQALRSVLAYEECSAHQSLLQVSRAPAAAPADQQQQQQQGPHEATFDHWMEAITTCCFLMAVSRPSMAAVGNAASDVMLQLQRELEARAEPFEPTAGCARSAGQQLLCTCCCVSSTILYEHPYAPPYAFAAVGCVATCTMHDLSVSK